MSSSATTAGRALPKQTPDLVERAEAARLKNSRLLDSVQFPKDIREFSQDQLIQLADEVRAEMIDAVSVTGGHLGAGLGMAVARDLAGRDNNVIAVIGDGAMSAGMAYEAMNNAGSMDSRLIVVLNDNDMSIAPPWAP